MREIIVQVTRAESIYYKFLIGENDDRQKIVEDIQKVYEEECREPVTIISLTGQDVIVEKKETSYKDDLRIIEDDERIA